jgi:hypothetical protein
MSSAVAGIHCLAQAEIVVSNLAECATKSMSYEESDEPRPDVSSTPVALRRSTKSPGHWR